MRSNPSSTPMRACRALVIALVLVLADRALSQTCTFNANQPNTTSFGTVDTTLSTTYTWSLTVNYKCTGNANAVFTITSANQSGPGAYRMQNTSQPAQYMAYTISTVDVPGTKVTLTGQLVAANYRNAYVGNYTDTLSVLVTP